jgi:hypothetical protein
MLTAIRLKPLPQEPRRLRTIGLVRLETRGAEAIGRKCRDGSCRRRDRDTTGHGVACAGFVALGCASQCRQSRRLPICQRRSARSSRSLVERCRRMKGRRLAHRTFLAAARAACRAQKPQASRVPSNGRGEWMWDGATGPSVTAIRATGDALAMTAALGCHVAAGAAGARERRARR